MKQITINAEQELYVIPSAGGWSCLGFDVLERRYTGLASELAGLGVSIPMPELKGTIERYKQYGWLTNQAQELHQRTGWRSKSELTKELIGLEGKRVEIKHRWNSGREETVRFQVGKSTGFIPCHLELANARSSGGGAVCLGQILSVQIVK